MLIRRAMAEDVPDIVAVYAADETGGHGDRWSPETEAGYRAAFARIDGSRDAELFVVVADGAVVATFMLNFHDGLVGGGVVHCQLHAVSVAPEQRSKGIGARIVRAAEERARARGARKLSLVSNKRRVDAHRFYEREGYLRTHEGFTKLL